MIILISCDYLYLFWFVLVNFRRQRVYFETWTASMDQPKEKVNLTKYKIIIGNKNLNKKSAQGALKLSA